MTAAPLLARVRLVASGGLLACLLAAPLLWRSSRPFPLVPLVEGLPSLPAPFDALLAVALLLAVAGCALPRVWVRAAPAALLLSVLLLIGDQMRLQPWFWQGLLTFGAFTWLARRPDRADDVVALLRLLVVATYFWSGVHKTHPVFAREGWPWLVEPLAAGWPDGPRQLVHLGGWLAGPLEALQGLALASCRWRRVGVVLACTMHLFILAMVGPWGHDWNLVVWPWNLTMVGLVLLLFAGAPGRTGSLLPRGAPALVALLLLGLLPAGHLAGRADAYLSFSLYSYAAPTATFVLGDEVARRLPMEAAAAIAVDERGRTLLPADQWSVATLGVPVPPARRIFRALHRQLCALGAGPDAAHLVLRTPRRWQDDSLLELYRCGDAEPSVRQIVP